ncbi:MAG TPA: hypothetical protein ACFE0H_03335 [Elainellaceae cyanobacterium]|jgi:hypothetical protein
MKASTSSNSTRVGRTSLNAPSSKSLLPRFNQLLRTLGRSTVRFLTQGHEIRIWQTTSRNGTIRWHAYDPSTDQRVTLSSEAEIRSWLEQRYRW